MNTAVYMLRCKQLGLSMDELDILSCGMVWDMLTEKSNDSYDYPLKAGQKEYHAFLMG
jgi:hypothetical protein